MTIHLQPLPIKTISPQSAYYHRVKDMKSKTDPNALNYTQLKRMGGTGYVKREREDGEATSSTINLMKQPRYKPAKHLDPRQGIAQ